MCQQSASIECWDLFRQIIPFVHTKDLRAFKIVVIGTVLALEHGVVVARRVVPAFRHGRRVYLSCAALSSVLSGLSVLSVYLVWWISYCLSVSAHLETRAGDDRDRDPSDPRSADLTLRKHWRITAHCFTASPRIY